MLLSGVSGADEYGDSIQKWQKERDSVLRRTDGWLTLAGLFWLKPGANTFGSDPKCDMKLPRGPKQWGSLSLKGDLLECKLSQPVALQLNEKDANGAKADLKLPEGTNKFVGEGMVFLPIKRDGRWAIRLKDSKSSTLLNFKGMKYFQADPQWRVKAKFAAFPTARRTKAKSMLGTMEEEVYPGEIVLDYQGKSYHVLAAGEPGSQSYYLNFADKTNGKTTYGGGRYVYFDAPKGGSGEVVVDFNQAYTPPCGFTHFATCSLVPDGNRLPFAIKAGEQFSEH
jgi:uncharacterized protein (DUF1684 family)